MEADLREARAKLDILLAIAPLGLQRSDPEKGDEEVAAGRSDGKEGEGRRQSRPDGNSNDTMHEEAGGEGQGRADRSPKRQQDARRSPETHVASTKKSEGFAARAKGTGKGSQQQSGRGEGRSRGNDVGVAGTSAAPSAKKRLGRGADEPATTNREPREANVKGRSSSVKDTETTPEPALMNRNKKAGAPNRRQAPIVAAKEKRSKQRETTNDPATEHDSASKRTIVDDRKSASPAEGELQKLAEASMTGRGEETRDEGHQAGHEGVAEAFTVGNPCGTAGEEAPQDQRSGGTSGKTVAKRGSIETKAKSSPTSLKHERSPQPSPRRQEGIPSPPAQLRKPPKSPQERPTDQSRPKPISTDDAGDVGADDPAGREHLGATSNASGEEGVANEVATEATGAPRQGEVAEDPGADERYNTGAHKISDGRAKVGTKPLGGQTSRDPVARRSASRSPGKAARTKPTPRAAKIPPTRVGITTKAKRALVEKHSEKEDGAAASTSERASPEHVAAEAVAEDAQGAEKSELVNLLGGSGAGSAAPDSAQADRAVGDEGGAEGGGAARSNAADEGNGDVPNATVSSPNEVICLEMRHAPTGMSLQDAGPVGGDCNGSWGGEDTGKRSTGIDKTGGDDNPLPRDVADLAEALRFEVDRLRLERAELEDTVAQLNVAAAQLYFVEYEQMKASAIDLHCLLFFCRGEESQKPTSPCARGFPGCNVKRDSARLARTPRGGDSWQSGTPRTVLL